MPARTSAHGYDPEKDIKGPIQAAIQVLWNRMLTYHTALAVTWDIDEEFALYSGLRDSSVVDVPLDRSLGRLLLLLETPFTVAATAPRKQPVGGEEP